MKKAIFKGSGVALVTPMDDFGNVDYKVLKQLINFHLDNQTDAIIICGTTGESSTLTHDEKVNIIRTTVDAVDKKIPVIVGTGSNNTVQAIEMSVEAEHLGADALLIVTPYYNKTSQSGLIRHYFSIADKVNIPIILYNVPSRTGVNIKPSTYLELSKHPNICAVKEANGDISSVAETRYLCQDNLHIYSGNDDQIVPVLSLGGIGVISVLANICPKETHEIVTEYLLGNTKNSSDLQINYNLLIKSLFADVNPVPIKYALNLYGFYCGNCRLPLDILNSSVADNLKNVLYQYGLIK